MARTIQIPATLDSCNRKKDRSVSFKFTSLREVSTEDYMIMDSFFQNSGHLMFRENAFTEEDIPNTDVTNSDLKSSSQRLRSVLYAYHMQKDGDPAKFRSFYESTMEKYINKVKESLE